MKTIPKNAKRIVQLKTELTVCTVYTLDNYFTGTPCRPAFAWNELKDGFRTKLVEINDGLFVVQVHGNKWYELRKP